MKIEGKHCVLLMFGFAFGFIAACLLLHKSTPRTAFSTQASLTGIVVTGPLTANPAPVPNASSETWVINLGKKEFRVKAALGRAVESENVFPPRATDSFLQKPNVDLMDSRPAPAADLRDLQ